VSDLESIRDFIAKDSPHYGNVVVARLVEAMDRIRDFPECRFSKPFPTSFSKPFPSGHGRVSGMNLR
jgi:hypothetical protein